MRVLIVDDEPAILRALVNLTLELQPEWALDSCLNALEAKDKLSRQPYDLLLTDIHLPVMNGLQLAEWVSEQRYRTRVVMISGYSDFDYARTAMRLGINHYLLKPIEKAAYGELLSELEDEMRQRRSQQRRDRLKQSLVNLPEDKSGAGVEPAADSEWETFHGSRFWLLLACYGGRVPDWQEAAAQKLDALQNCGLESFVRAALQPEEDCWVFDSPYGTISLIISFPEGRAEPGSREILSRLTPWLNEHPPLVLISGGLLCRTEELARRQKQMLKRLGQLTGLSGGYWLNYDTPVQELSDKLLLDWKQRYRLFWETQVSFLASADWVKAWRELVALWRKNDLRQEQNERELTSFCHAAEYCYAAQLAAPAVSILTPTLKEALSAASGWEDFCSVGGACLKDFLDDFALVQATVLDHHARTAFALKLFLDEHYKENFSNAQLAARYGYSPSYLSNIFRSHLGLSPNEYLNDLRIRQAKHLFCRDPELTTHEVALSVGFSDSSYFSRVFKKLTGQAPSVFRQCGSAAGEVEGGKAE